MVRLQKVIYEKVINGSSRARQIASPRKWYYANPYQHLRLNHFNFLNKTLLGKVWAPIAKFFNMIQMRLHLDIFRQQGLTPEDRLLHLDRHLRRNVLFEHMARQTLHPYHWVLKARRRERFSRIDFAAPGFFVPEHVRAQAATQTYVDYLRLQNEWANHVYNNYYSDMTPEARRSVVPKINPLQLLQNFGVLRNEAWDRYFMNEHENSWFTRDQTKAVRDHKTFPFNLTSQKGKKDFQEYINDFNQKVPGAFAPPGQKFDFKSYYQYLGV